MSHADKIDKNNTFYVTTPIYYVTAKPHLGSLYSTLLADVAARWNKLQGKKTFFVTGTDEHGQKIALAAEKAGMAPQAFVDSFIGSYEECWKKYSIDYNHFVRTTDPEHKKAVTLWIEKLLKTGDIYKDFYSGWYCTPCETFVTEAGETAPACTSCTRITEKVQEETYFFRLSRYQDRLLEFYKNNPDFITPKERVNEIISFVKSGLKDLSISRTTLSWGIPFPGDSKHVVYVWADALLNYISAIGYGDAQSPDAYRAWWPAQLQILGKDIVRFHAVYWPAFLWAADIAVPEKLLVHGWIQVDKQKMSKSFGNTIDPVVLQETYGTDPVRYYLVRYMAITQDAEFSIADLEQKITSDLANDLGNLLNRIMILAQKNDRTVLQAPEKLDQATAALKEKIDSMLKLVEQDAQDYFFHKMYAHAWKAISEINAYFHAQEPWKKARTHPEEFQAILSATVHALYTAAVIAWPVMPEKMEKLLAALGREKIVPGHDYIAELNNAQWHEEFTLNPTIFSSQETLFLKYLEKKEEQTVPPLQNREEIAMNVTSSITIDDFTKIQLRVGTIIECNEVPKSAKLYALKVDFGPEGIRQILSGIRMHYTPEELVGKQGTFVFNLQPRSMAGMESQGMMLFAQDQSSKLVMTTVATPVANGTLLS